MDFMFPHAILATPDNAAEILTTVPLSHDNLFSIIDDGRAESMRYYIVGWIDSVTGIPTFQTYSEVELACEYRLKTVNQFWSHFTKL